ncbi:MAG TPA: Maf family protein [Candidatus Colwellbacteria bacterium]|jgi:septum formation protein|nr:Maf family protein [Candidatus Colwellbacteria bacterium]
MKKIILASNSFLKKLVLEKSKLDFNIDPADIDESKFDYLDPEDRVRGISLEKCESVRDRHPESIIIAADTLTLLDGETIGKPKDMEEAYRMAIKQSGKKILALTGITLYDPRKGFFTKLSKTRITYQKFDRSDLERLFKDNFPLRMASGLGLFIDAPGFTLVQSINGSYTGAYGMPMEIVYKYLHQFGHIY